MTPRPGSIPDNGLPCIEHGMTIEQHEEKIVGLVEDVKRNSDDILVLKTEANSRAKSMAQLTTLIVALLSAAGTIYTLLRHHQ